MGIGNIALSGLQAAMTHLESISDNIANVNTVGFKKSFVNFADISISSLASVNQVGLGVSVQSVQQDFSTGTITSSDSGLDLSLGNSGFFVQRDPSSGLVSYTRAGRLSLDNSGFITGLNGRVQGYPAQNGSILSSGSLVDLQIPTQLLPAQSTSNVNLSLNLNANDAIPANSFSVTDPTSFNYQTNSTIYDSLGNATPLSLYFVKQSNNTWTAQAFVNGTNIGAGTVNYSDLGALSSATGLTGLNWSPTDGAVSPQSLSINLTNSTQFAIPEAVYSNQQDGFQAGTPVGFNIDINGNINVSYSNGQALVQGQIAVANFTSPENLAKSTNMSWLASNASGTAILSPSNSQGAINSNSLELSNVDLTEELVNLLDAQHDFQANAQVQQTYNQILQTIENL